MPEPTIVLVHGAWADASSWNTVATGLRSRGVTVLAPPNLLRAVPIDAPHISSFLAQRTSGRVEGAAELGRDRHRGPGDRSRHRAAGATRPAPRERTEAGAMTPPSVRSRRRVSAAGGADR